MLANTTVKPSMSNSMTESHLCGVPLFSNEFYLKDCGFIKYVFNKITSQRSKQNVSYPELLSVLRKTTMKEQISYQKETEWTDKGLRVNNIIKGLLQQHLSKPPLLKKKNPLAAL